jgi:hypothetical protein
MDILTQLYTQLLVQPIYNALVAIYATVGQSDSGTTLILVGIASCIVFMPAIIRNHFDQEQAKAYQEQIHQIQSQTADQNERQQKITTFLKTKGVRFQSESLFLFGQAIVLFLLYPVLLNHWSHLEPSLLYSFTPQPEQLSPAWLNISVNYSSPTLSLLPAILLFLELRQSYKEQRFLTSFVDKWYPVLLPLFTYFLIFWLPSGLSLVLSASLLVSLYLRTMMQLFTKIRHNRRSPASA